MTEKVDEKALIALSLSGDREAFRQLVELYQEKLFRLVFQVVRSREDAEDIVQESFVKAYLSLNTFRGQSSFYTWLYRIAFNMAIDFKRKVSRRGGEALGVEEIDQVDQSQIGPVENPQDALIRRESGKQIQLALEGLSEEHRAVIVLREVDGLHYDEIARVVGVSKGTVMSRLHYARKRMHEALRKFDPDVAVPVDDSSSEIAELELADVRSGRKVSVR